ncbi:unnamed protein product [Caenorhabditis bovis]|uniref:Uncharacterized protein n=1 Tax=Caenorhabditis bovis TaxID=2654633 RepID=A0A8S1ER54_9PELO|nr:unnamed protein product [Caenorhabditis bovis]
MARTLDPTSNSIFAPPAQPFATNWTQDSWYNVYSWVNSQSNDSEGGESRSSSSSQPQTSPQSGSGGFDDRDHPLLCDRDAPSSPFDRLETSSRPSPLFFNNNNNSSSKDVWPNPLSTTQNETSDYDLIHELLKLNLNTAATSSNQAAPAPARRSSANQLFSSSSPSTSSPWSLPPDEPLYRPAPVASRHAYSSTNATWQSGSSNDYDVDIFTQLSQQLGIAPQPKPQQPSGVDMTYIMQQQQIAAQQQQQQHLQQSAASFPNKSTVQRYNIFMQMQTRIDETSEEYRQLEKERKQTEAELARHHLGKKISSSNTLPIPRLPTAPSKVDRLIVDFFREHARISTLVAKMEQLTMSSMPSAVHQTLAELLDAITMLQTHRNVERNVILQRLRGETPIYDDEKEAMESCQILMHVRRAATRVRAANWCCLMNTLGPIDETQMSQLGRIVASDYTIAPPPIRPRPIKI